MAKQVHTYRSYELHLKANYLFWFVLICMFLVACEQAQPDRSYLEGVPCLAPCWQGITPGITEEADALKILSDRELVIQDSIDCHVNADNSSRGRCSYWRTSSEGGSTGFENGLVTGLELLSRKLTIDEVIMVLGPPDFVDRMFEFDDLELGVCYEMYVYYLRGIRLRVKNCEPKEASINAMSDGVLTVFANMNVTSLLFFQPANTLEMALSNITATNLYTLPDTYIQTSVVNAQPWIGYGQYPLTPRD